MKAIGYIILFIISVGWLVPICFGVIMFDLWIWKEVFPVLYDSEKEMNSLPYYQASHNF